MQEAGPDYSALLPTSMPQPTSRAPLGSCERLRQLVASRRHAIAIAGFAALLLVVVVVCVAVGASQSSGGRGGKGGARASDVAATSPAMSSARALVSLSCGGVVISLSCGVVVSLLCLAFIVHYRKTRLLQARARKPRARSLAARPRREVSPRRRPLARARLPLSARGRRSSRSARCSS